MKTLGRKPCKQTLVGTVLKATDEGFIYKEKKLKGAVRKQ